jgi:hypothetical protein
LDILSGVRLLPSSPDSCRTERGLGIGPFRDEAEFCVVVVVDLKGFLNLLNAALGE